MRYKFTKYEIIIICISIILLCILVVFVINHSWKICEYHKVKIIDNKKLIFECDIDLTNYFKINDILNINIENKEIKSQLLSVLPTEKNTFLFQIKFLNSTNFFKYSDIYIKIPNSINFVGFFRKYLMILL